MPKPTLIGEKDIYELQEQIGNGAFSTVFRGRRLSTGQTVAIKKMKSMTKTTVEMVNKQIQIMDGLRHKNIVEYYANFRFRGDWYIVLEYCGKGDMEQYKKKVGKVPEYHCKLFVKCVMEALIFMHSKNIAHRDLKLSNILITDDYQLKLADFGFSKDSEEGYFTSFCGTPLSMAPEILRREKYSPKCDVWSLGVLTFMMLYNRPPFFPTRAQGVGLPGIINAVVNRSHRFDANVKVSESGREFIDLCLDKDANKRVSILTLKDHPWFQEGVDLNRTSEDRQEAISTSLKDERSAGVTLCKLMLFGVFEQHLKKMVETMQLSEQSIMAVVRTLDDYYLDSPVREYYLLLVTKKLQKLRQRQLVLVIENSASYHLPLSKINRFSQFVEETTSLVYRELLKVKDRRPHEVNLDRKIMRFVMDEVELLFDCLNENMVAEKQALLRSLCELVLREYGGSKISVRWGGNGEYQDFFEYVAEYLAKLTAETVTGVINEELSNQNDLEAVWLIENEVQSCEAVSKEGELGKMMKHVLSLSVNFTADRSPESEQVEVFCLEAQRR